MEMRRREHKTEIADLMRCRGGRSQKLEFRITKPATRPKGGSPKDNCEFEKTQDRLEIVDFLIGSRLDVVDRSQEEECRL